MNNDALIEQHIDAVDAFARTLFVRAKQIPSLFQVATAVKELHDALRHLRVEAADPDSLLSNALTPEAANFSRQLPNIVEDCEFALSQLERLLDDEDGAPESRATSLKRKLQNVSDNINDFLDDVQLFSQSQASSTTLVSGREPGLDDIKDKLDNVARRIFTGRTNSSPREDDGLWREFKTELEKEGFSKEVLHQHKDVLRAYIRELEALCPNDGGTPPTVRGLLEYESQSAMVASPAKELMHPDGDNEKFAPSMKNSRRMPEDAPVLPPRPNETMSTQYASSMEDDSSENGESMALISTKDLVAMDSLNTAMADMQLRPYGQAHPVGSPPLASPSIGSHPSGHDGLIPANAASLDPPREVYELPGSPSTSLLGSSPQYAPLPTYSSVNSPPPAYSQAHASQRAPMRLAPDRHGRDIGMEAQWTRIPRHLVSPEVLEKTGVRYEARPTYVAILGRLSREEVKEFARRSADCRAARSMRQSPSRKPATQSHERNDSRSSNEEEDDDSTLFDSGESTDVDDDKTSDKGTKGYPYIVSPPERERGSPSSTVQPKSILKNKNTNHVHFGRNPYEVESKSPRSLKDDRDRKEPPRRTRDHRSSETSRHRRDRDEDGARYRESRDRHDRERRRYDDRDRDRDHYSRRRHRDDRYYDDRRGRDQRRSKKKAWGETLGAVGVGGAAVSLLGVLAQAATGM